jgi:hypothetical protein
MGLIAPVVTGGIGAYKAVEIFATPAREHGSVGGHQVKAGRW